MLHELNRIVLPLAFAAIVFSAAGIRSGRPSSTIVARWAMWLCASLASAILMQELGLTQRPLWAVLLICLLVWFLVETAYNWVAIGVLSRSGLSLFPVFRSGFNGGEWPASRSFIKLREAIRQNHFHLAEAMIGQIGGSDVIRGCVYDSEDGTLRLEVIFMPMANESLQSFMSLSSILDDGCRVVTDNIFLPFGGFYPENILLERRPLMRSLRRLLRHHTARLRKIGRACVKWDCDPVEDLNREQRELEQLNTRMGFLVEASQREECGNISKAGRYRIWKEIWMLNYFGRPFSY